MEPFIDYYQVLGVPRDAAPAEIKSAYRRLARKYHPDYNKDPDAERQMRLINQAYQVLNDPEERRAYDQSWARHVQGSQLTRQATRSEGERAADEATTVRTGYILPGLSRGAPATVVLNGIPYALSAAQVSVLLDEGMLRGMMSYTGRQPNETTPLPDFFYCQRCYHQWRPTPLSPARQSSCPNCGAEDWDEYLLMYCRYCQAVFASQEVRDTLISQGRYYFPYELFPLCPCCRASHWCAAEEERLQAKQKAWQQESVRRPEETATGAIPSFQIEEERDADPASRQGKRFAWWQRLRTAFPSGSDGQSLARSARGTLQQPVWRWVLIGSILMLGAGLTGLLPGSDWADGSLRLGLVALAEGGIAFVAFLIQCWRSVKKRGTFSSQVLLATLLLLVLGGGAMGLQTPLHRAQGHAFQRAGAFASAIEEFQLAGDVQDEANAYAAWGQRLQEQKHYMQAVQTLLRGLRLSLPPDLKEHIRQQLAHAYYLWGVQLEQQSLYEKAIDAFESAHELPQSSTERQHTEEDLAQVYYLWGEQLAAQGQYDQAASAFQQALSWPLSPAEVPQAREEFAKSILKWGEQLLGRSEYESAISVFQEVLLDPQSFQKTSSFPQIYQDAAKAYVQLGKQQEAHGNCSDAASSFKTVMQHFGDTPSAQQARVELQKPQQVTGTIFGIDGKPAAHTRLFLSANYQIVRGVNFTASDDYTAVSDSTGAFVFTNVLPREKPYLISYINILGVEETLVQVLSSTFVYLVVVQPLCPTSAGDIYESSI